MHVKWTQGTKSLEEQKPQPFLGNLYSHTLKHSNALKPQEETTHKPVHYHEKAVELMKKTFLEEGLINPATPKTQRGFLRLFAEWLVLEDLPWTTGEAPSLKRLFHFMEVS
jgi:hypothetical protein